MPNQPVKFDKPKQGREMVFMFHRDPRHRNHRYLSFHLNGKSICDFELSLLKGVIQRCKRTRMLTEKEFDSPRQGKTMAFMFCKDPRRVGHRYLSFSLNGHEVCDFELDSLECVVKECRCRSEEQLTVKEFE